LVAGFIISEFVAHAVGFKAGWSAWQGQETTPGIATYAATWLIGGVAAQACYHYIKSWRTRTFAVSALGLLTLITADVLSGIATRADIKFAYIFACSCMAMSVAAVWLPDYRRPE
jgi:hypothetical protein